ncbi:DUF1735 domain-containing protein [Labilibacter marinus]|uniref:DUF1735 domain-containing protein n=1 Tax=Labilibacter marinus TaxID=1477105 RepID=UPI0013013134|nr:DUF1735 domain-containing protein [Labilibacter marinus]
MNSIKKLILASVCLMFILQSCYEDYKFDYEYTSTYFSYQYPLRTLVVEDQKDLKFDFGVVLGGKRSNNSAETVDYVIDPSLITDIPELQLLPADRYTISGTEGQLTIPSGEITGRATVTIDKDWFLDQEQATGVVYALPIQIVDHSTDSVTDGKDFTIIALRYFNEFHGVYWLNGADKKYNFLSNEVEDEFVYTSDDEVIRGYKRVDLTTVDSATVKAAYTGRQTVGNYSMLLNIRKADGVVTITPDPESEIKELSGTGLYDVQDGALYLDYTYYYDDTHDEIRHEVKDTLYYLDTYLELEEWTKYITVEE